LNTYKGENPIVLAHVPIAGGGNAQRVSIDGTFIAVAAGDAGLVIIDEAIPATANITQQVPLTGASAVTAAGGMAFVGTTAGTVASVNLVSGRLVDLISLNTPIRDLAVLGEYVYALTDDRLFAISFANRTLSLSGSTASPFPAGPNLRLFVGGEIAYAVHRTGYNTFDLTNPAQPVLVQTGTSQQFGWKQMTLNGSGLALAAVGPNSTDDGTHDISLYDVSNPTNAITALTTFPTPGLARAVALWEGLAYVADDTAGLQVIYYLAYDGNGIAPQIKLSTSFNLAPAQIAENSPARVTADASDDVQVRNVEFYLDGTLVEKDGNFPFEFRFIAPQRTTSKTSFSLRARSTDTGGNFTWSDEVTVTLLPDTAPPQVTRISPRSIVAGIRSVSVSFDEQMDPGSLTPSALKLWESGPDALLGTADDVEVLPGRGEVLRRYQDEGWRLIGLSWQPEIADETMTTTDVDAGFTRMQELLGVTMEVEYCPHAAGPPVCWCRKPLPGLGVLLMERHQLDASACIYVGAGPQDPGFARRLGFAYRSADDFFGRT
jgi:histidinol phosphatase-like enzyme